MMNSTRIYLVRAYSRESYDDSNYTVDAFVDKNVADKVAAGFDDATDTRINTWIIKQAERNEKLADINYLLDGQYEKQAQAIYDEYEKYEVYFDTYYYQVYEIDLIN